MKKDTYNSHANPLEQLEAIRANDESVLKKLYRDNFSKTAAFVLRNNGTEEDAKDIYQEAFLAVWRNIQLDKFHPESATALEGYLYRISCNKWLDHLRSAHHKNVTTLKEGLENEPDITDNLSSQEQEYLQQVKKHFVRLGDNCRDILTRFYYKKESLRIISEAMKWTEATARNNKYRCIERLKTLMKNNSVE